ncbi:MAG: dipicolinate synthase subunit DpsA [Oscillospiraceae bacterium]
MYNLIMVGGDKRQLYLKEFLNQMGFSVFVYGFSNEDSIFLLNDKLKAPNSIVILPLPMTRDKENVNFSLSDEVLPLSFISERMKKGDVLFGGIIKEDFKSELTNKGVNVIDFYDEDFILKNAYLTGICTVRIILENIDYDISTAAIALTGYGRTGKEIAKALNSVGANVTVIARNKEALNTALTDGFKVCELSGISNIADSFDILINTVPAVIIKEDTISKLKKTTTLIEIASPPFGIDFDEAEKCGIKVIKALSLPGKFVPKTAGELIGEKIVNYL